MAKEILNLDQVVAVHYSYEKVDPDFTVVAEKKWFFGLLVEKKHILVEPLTHLSGLSEITLPFCSESVDKILSPEQKEYSFYNSSNETFYRKAWAQVKMSNGSYYCFYFDTNQKLDEFLLQFNKLNLVNEKAN